MEIAQKARRDREAEVRKAEQAVFDAIRVLAQRPNDSLAQLAVSSAYNEYTRLYDSDLGNAVAKALSTRGSTNLAPAIFGAMSDAKKSAEADEARAIEAVQKVIREHTGGTE